MKKSSWIILGICAVLIGVLALLYVQSRQTTPDMTQGRITSMLDQMKSAVAHKDIKTLMSFVDQSPETRISKLNSDQLRMLLSRSFRQSEQLDANYSALAMHHEGSECTAEFDLSVTHHMAAGDGQDYNGHVTLYLQLEDVSHLFGLYHSKEWKIVKAETTGTDLSTYGDY